MIWTENIEETIAFYTEKLGFICGDKNDEWGWAGLYNDEVELMIAKPNEHTPFDKPIFTGSFYFRIDDADKLWEELRGNVKVAYEIEDFDWGMREFAIYDNNGYLLQFGHDLRS